LPGLPTPHGAKEELVIKLVEKAEAVSVFLHYVVYEKEDVIGRYLEVVNEGEDGLVLHKAMSMQLVLPNQDFEMVSLYGSWAGECNRQVLPIGRGRLVMDSINGFSSNRHNPLFLLKAKEANHEHGVVYGFNFVYSGNHQESVEMDTWQNVRIQQGISPFMFAKSLAKGSSFVTPMAVMSYSPDGLNGLSYHFQDFVNDCVIPSQWKDAPRPIVYNNWEATTFKFNKAKLVSLMKKAASIGAETFVLDDGWFGTRDDDSHGLGDWVCNTKKIPGGLKALADQAKKLKLSFGIWMEPEMVNEHSKLYAAHPDWIIHDEKHVPTQGRHQFVLDLRKPEVQDYLYQSVSGVLHSADIHFLKWDCNRPFSDCPAGYSPFFHDYVLGLYQVLDKLSKEFPHVLFENCASGGNRYDLGMLSYFPQSWMSDDTDSFQRLYIQSGAALGYPQSTFSNHVAAKTSNQLLRMTSLDSKFDVAAFGVLGYELDLNDLTPLDEKTLKKQTAYYKAHRQLLQFGRFSELEDFSQGNGQLWEVNNEKEALIGRYEALQKPNPKEAHLRAVNLEAASFYHYESRPESISLKKFGHLINMALPVHLAEDGLAVTLLSKHKDMASEVEAGEVSGAALSSGGVVLDQEWSGVGYNEHIRLIGDFGGRLYYLAKK
jgi:alpha-galactosidase